MPYFDRGMGYVFVKFCQAIHLRSLHFLAHK